MNIVPRASAAATLLVVALVAGWFFLLRPSFLGGPASYIIVQGQSMEPTLHSGDLAVLGQQDEYHPGDVVAFNVEGGVVIHRIVGGTAEEGFVTQGDNKDGADVWRPTADDIVGRLWFSIPGGGQFLLRLREPMTLGLMAGGLGMLTVLLAPAPTWQPKLSVPGRDRRRPAEDTDKA